MDLSSLLFARVSFLFRESAQNAKRFSAGEEHFRRESVSLSLSRARAAGGFFFLLWKVVFVVVVLSREKNE
jgi:hypothetical protein